MNNVVIGQYIPGKSFLHKLDPRSKLIGLMLLMISTFIFSEIIHVLILLGIVFVILLFGGIPIGRILKGLRPIMFLLVFTFVFQVLFVQTGDLMYDITFNMNLYNMLIGLGIILFWYFTKSRFPFKMFYFVLMVFSVGYVLQLDPIGSNVFNTLNLKVYQDGLSGAFFVLTRLVIIVTLSTILTLTTKPTDLTLGLEKLLKPFSVIGLNAEEFALIISLALRYIPTLLDEANKIMLAQASRGVDFNEGKLKDKVTQIVSLLIPMFIISFNRSDDLANAMEARNFTPGKTRTRLHILKWRYSDTLTVMFSVFVMVCAIVVVVI